jgi:hypothetical protein
MELMFYDMQTKSAKGQFSLIAIDPHGDFAQRICTFHNTDCKRLVYISSAINREAKTDSTYTAIINPFETRDLSLDNLNILGQELTEAISELLADTSHALTVQMTAILRPCITTVLMSKTPSLETLARFFLDTQNADLVELGRQSPIPIHKSFFEHDFYAKEYVLTKRAIRTKLLYFLADPMLFNMLCGKSTIDLEQCINEGKVIIFNLPKGAGKFTSAVFSRLMIALIHTVMLRRESIDMKKRKPCYLFLDEFQTVISGTGSLADSLAETRKYGLSLILATQSLKQIESATLRKTVMVNTGTKMVGLTDHEDKSTFAKEFGAELATFTKLEPLQFVIKRNTGKHTAFTFRVPILANRYFKTNTEKKELLNYLVYQSGIYQKIVPPPPPPYTQTEQKTNNEKASSKKKKENPSDENFTPAF